MKAGDVYDGSDGAKTTAFYRRLQLAGPVGHLAMNLFRAQKCSYRAKQYRGGIRGKGSYKSMAYERKNFSMSELCKILIKHGAELGISWGWKRDPNVIFENRPSFVLYVDLPNGQISFHNPDRLLGPDYPGEWDGQRSTCSRILAFCDSVNSQCQVTTLFEGEWNGREKNT